MMNGMMSLMAMLADAPVTAAFHVVKYVLIVLSVLCAIFLILIILLQPGNSEGLGEIAGGAETFLGKNKAKTVEGKLKIATVVIAIVFVLSILALTILLGGNISF